MITLLHGDCLELMKDIEPGSIDLILTDPPYGTTACKWDTVIPFEPMWKEIKRVRKERAAVALFGSEPFSSYLRMSNIKEFKYDWIWEKEKGVGFQVAKYRPMLKTENISVFCKGALNYYPVMVKRDKPITYRYPTVKSSSSPIANYNNKKVTKTHKYPVSLLYFNTERGQHPTQKPITLLEYLIKTYTNEGDTVLDFTMGSGSTGVACKNLNRRFIGIEQDEKYFNIAKERIHDS